MPRLGDAEFNHFFDTYAGNVDYFYEASYWRLCDEIIRKLIRRHLHIGPGDRLLDAGGGTARWAVWAAAELGVHVTVADRSSAMLARAEENLVASGRQADVDLIECDLEDAPALDDERFDAVVSIYNMLSFLDDPAAAMRTVARVLRPGGQGLLMGQGYANALASKINRDGATPAELRQLADTQIVQWAEHVPPLRVFSAADLESLVTAAGLRPRQTFGVTTLVTPGPEDFTYPYVKMSAISLALDNPEYFDSVLGLELKVNGRKGWSDRGVNLVVWLERP